MAKVLVVDDDANNRLLLVTLLRHAGHEAVEAADANTALLEALRETPALAVVDLSLPDMPGTELIRRLRRNASTAAMKIALYTATPSDAAVRELTDLYGISGILPKPGDPDAILEIFSTLLDAPRS